MHDPSIIAFRRMRRSERILELHIKARDHERAESAYAEVMADSETFESTPPTTAKGLMVKGKVAIVTLESGEYEAPAKMLRHYFKSRRSIDGAWLRDFRFHNEAVKILAPANDYTIACLQSILAGMSKPRLA